MSAGEGKVKRAHHREPSMLKASFARPVGSPTLRGECQVTEGVATCLRLPHPAPHRISRGMRPTVVLFMLALATPVLAQTPHKPAKPAKPAAGPKELGKFDDWIAATHQESGQTVCYAFVPAKTSVPAVPRRGEVVLTVTERPTGRDTVAISAGLPIPQGRRGDRAGRYRRASISTPRRAAPSPATARPRSPRSRRASQALARSPGPRDGQVIVDTFSLRGFTAAYAAINKACPAR